MKRGVLLDRDGTLIDVVRDEETGVITTAFHPSHLRILPGVVEGLRLLRDAGFVFGIATNQPGPAKGHFGAGAVTRTNEALVERLRAEGIAIAAVRACMHHPLGGPGGDPALIVDCECRKPNAGMVHGLIDDLGLTREGTWMVGDSEADVEAGAKAGVRTGLLFATTRCELCPLRGTAAEDVSPKARPTVHGATLKDVARAVLALPSSVFTRLGPTLFNT